LSWVNGIDPAESGHPDPVDGSYWYPPGGRIEAGESPERAARRELDPMDEQDRSRWDGAEIAQGIQLVDGALDRGVAGPIPAPGGHSRPSTTGRRAPM